MQGGRKVKLSQPQQLMADERKISKKLMRVTLSVYLTQVFSQSVIP